MTRQLGVLWTIALWALCLVPSAWGQLPSLHLEEVFATALPDGSAFDGAAISDDGRVVVWAGGAPLRLWTPHGEAWSTLPAHVPAPLSAAFTRGGRSMEVVDTSCSCLFYLDSAGAAHRQVPIRSPFSIEAA